MTRERAANRAARMFPGLGFDDMRQDAWVGMLTRDTGNPAFHTQAAKWGVLDGLRTRDRVSFPTDTPPEVVDDRWHPERWAVERDTRRWLRGLMRDQLSPLEHAVVAAVFWHDLQRTEVAARVGVSPSRVSQLLRSALLKLRHAVTVDSVVDW